MPLIALNMIGKRYDQGAVPIHALREISLEISQRESVAIMGPSGSGKSTVLGILGCLDSPTTGSYRLAEEEVARLSRAKLATIRNRRIGFVFQSFNLLPRLTALENVELPLVYAGRHPSDRTREAALLLEKLGLADRLAHLPSQLSGGQQQRVAIARALVTKPDLILADEPTGALDSETGKDILRSLRDISAGGTAVVVVTHDPIVAAAMQRVIVLGDGRIRSDNASNRPVQSVSVNLSAVS